MNNEIKEYVAPTLEYLKECVEDDIIFETSNCKALLDYITNLQDKIDKAIEYITSEESIGTFKTVESRDEWLKTHHNLLNILEGKDE